MEAPDFRKRKRAKLSCAECHRRKVRCDRHNPCRRCVATRARCVYEEEDNPGTTAIPGTSSISDAATSTRREVLPPQTEHGESTSPPRQRRRVQESTHELDRSHEAPVGRVTSRRQYLRGTMSKGRFFGNTHPITTYLQCDEMRETADREPRIAGRKDTSRSASLDEAQALIASAKATARAIKKQQGPLTVSLDPDTWYLPPRDICDTLVGHYMRIVEVPFRILHTVTFQREYEAFWRGGTKRRPLFTIILCLAMSIGLKFCREESTVNLIRPHIRQWLQACQSWLAQAKFKEIATITGLQAQCLLSIMLQFSRTKSEELWHAQGSLLRTATCMGLHLDGSRFPEMPFYDVEMRRRLWTTILELDLQAAMDVGTVPSMGDRSFDCQAPSNLNDDAFDEATTRPPREIPQSTATQSSLQIALHSSLPARVKICRLMNDFLNEPQYDDIIQETSAFVSLLAKNETWIESLSTNLGLSAVHRNIVIFLTRRFLIAMHRPFAQKALRDKHFHYSRKVCLDNALILLSCESDSDFDQILSESITYFRHIIHHAAILVCLEIIWQLKEDQVDKQLFQLRQKDRQRLLSFAQKVQRLAVDRLRAGETNVKAHVFLNMAIAQVEAMDQGLDITSQMMTASVAAAQKALEILQQHAQHSATDPDASHVTGPFDPDQGIMNLESLTPFSITDADHMSMELGDMGSWLFSNWVNDDSL